MTCKNYKTKPTGAPSSQKTIGMLFSQSRPQENTYLVIEFPSAWCGSVAWICETRLWYCAITLALDPPVINVKPAPHASLIFSLIILLASARGT